MPEDTESSSDESPANAVYDFRFKPDHTLSGGYQVIRGLRRGSLGEVYRVKHEDTARVFHLRWMSGLGEKELPPIKEHQEFASRHLIHVFDARVVDGGLAVVTEPFPACAADQIGPERRFESEDVLACGRSILSALDALEKKEVFPLVVAPESIACWGDGFALDEHYLGAAYLGSNRPVPLDRAAYLPPDLDSENPRASDAIYGVGATLYAMLTGRALVEGRPFEILVRAAKGDWTLDVPETWQDVLGVFLRADPASRPQSAAAALDRLRSLHGTRSSAEVRPSPVPGGRSPEPRDVPLEPSLEFVEINHRGHRVYLRRPEDVRMVLLPGGRFLMGSERGRELGRDNESPVIEVEVGAFLVDETPVNWGALQRMLERAGPTTRIHQNRAELLPQRYGGKSGSRWRWDLEKEIEAKIVEDQPVVMLTHREVSALAAALGLDLPSEAEWEYAYRGGTATEYYWGDEFDASAGWCSETAESGPQPTGRLVPNPFGLLDMAGNVFEMCRDVFHKACYASARAGDPGFSPTEIARGISVPGNRRSARGGSWKTGALSLRAAFRLGVEDDDSGTHVGLRYVIRKREAPDWAKPAFDEI